MSNSMFLKTDKIQGEVTDKAHEKEIAILSFSCGVSRGVTPVSTAGSANSGVASLTDMSFTKEVDASSPDLFKFACSGHTIGEAVVTVNRADGTGMIGYLKYILKEAVITNYAAGGTSGANLPTESFSLNFKSISVEYTPTVRLSGGAMGAKVASWNAATNQQA